MESGWLEHWRELGVSAKEIKNIDSPEMKQMFLECAAEYQLQAQLYLNDSVKGVS